MLVLCNNLKDSTVSLSLKKQICCGGSCGIKHGCGFKPYCPVCTVFRSLIILSPDETIAYFVSRQESQSLHVCESAQKEIYSETHDAGQKKMIQFHQKGFCKPVLIHSFLCKYYYNSSSRTFKPRFWGKMGKEIAGFHWLCGILDIQLLQASWKNPNLHLIFWKHETVLQDLNKPISFFILFAFQMTACIQIKISTLMLLFSNYAKTEIFKALVTQFCPLAHAYSQSWKKRNSLSLPYTGVQGFFFWVWTSGFCLSGLSKWSICME